MSRADSLRNAIELIDSADCELQRALGMKFQPLHNKLFEVIDIARQELDLLEMPEETDQVEDQSHDQ